MGVSQSLPADGPIATSLLVSAGLSIRLEIRLRVGWGRKPVTGVASNTALNRNGCVDDVAALVAFVAGFVTLSSNQKIAGDS